MPRHLVAALAVVLLAIPAALRAAPITSDDAARPASPTAPTLGRTGPRPPTRGTAAPATPAATPAPLAGLRRAISADSIVVEKSLRRLTLYSAGFPARTYDVALGKKPAGRKERAGDFRTPEGLYFIDARNPASQFHRGLHVSYPNADDLARARATGVSTGGDIMTQGLPNGQGKFGPRHRAFDWTNGCVAVTNQEIEEIWQSVPVGTPVRIKP